MLVRSPESGGNLPPAVGTSHADDQPLSGGLRHGDWLNHPRDFHALIRQGSRFLEIRRVPVRLGGADA